MAELNYLDDPGLGQGISNLGQSMSRAAIGMAALRQRQQQQEFENRLRLAEMERELRLEGVRERLYGAQTAQHKASTDLDIEKALQLRGLSKLADEVEATTFSEGIADVPDLEGRMYDPAKGSLFADTLGNRLRIANAKKKAALEKAVILGVAPAATRLRPFNVGQYGTIDQMTGEDIVPSQAPERLYNVPPENLLVTPEGEERARGLPRTRLPATGRSARDQAILHAIEALGRGATEDEFLNMVSKTNLLSAPMSSPLAAQPQAGQPVVIKTKTAYDALPSGTVYVGPDGKTATKR